MTLPAIEAVGSPQSGYPAAAIAVSPGVLATIPYPTNIPPGPVPTVLPFIVIVNSSPYALLVSQGMILTQIPAFTADSVRVPELGSGLTGVTILPQVGLTVPALGADSTVYATWYGNTPPGTYPSAIGAGAIRTIISDQIIPDATEVTMINFGPGSLGPFDVSAFSQLRLTVGVDSANAGPVGMIVQWATSTGGPTSPQMFVIPKGQNVPIGGGPTVAGFFKADMPVRGEQVTLFFFNDTAANPVNVFVNLSGTTVPGGAGVSFTVAGPSRSLAGGTGNLVGSATTSCAGAGATTTIGESSEVYGGPVTLVANMGGTWTATAGDLLRLEIQDSSGTWTSFSPYQPIAPTAGPMFQQQFFIPPVPFRVRLTNAAAGAVTPSIWVTPDQFRN